MKFIYEYIDEQIEKRFEKLIKEKVHNEIGRRLKIIQESILTTNEEVIQKTVINMFESFSESEVQRVMDSNKKYVFLEIKRNIDRVVSQIFREHLENIRMKYDRVSNLEREIISSSVREQLKEMQSEEFLDGIIDRIKRKQL